MAKQMVPVIIISACRADASTMENFEATGAMADELSRLGLPYKECDGRWGGRGEVVFVVVCRNQEAERMALRLAGRYGQQCVFALDEQRMASLIYLEDGMGMVPLGKLTSSSQYPGNDVDYTYDEVNDTYYYVRGHSYLAAILNHESESMKEVA